MRARPTVLCLVIVTAVLALPAAAQAQEGPTVDQETLVKPDGVAFDPYQPYAFVTTVGPPPGVEVYKRVSDEDWEQVGFTPLPADSDPGDIYYDFDDDVFYIQDHAQDRYFELCPECGSVTVHATPAQILFATGFAEGYNNWVMTDFGNGTSAGSLFYGPDFGSVLHFGDTIVPNGVDVLTGSGPVHGGRIPSEFLVIDAQNNDLIEVSDAQTPTVLGSLPGPPGASGLKPPRDIAVDPVNLNPNPLAAATHLVLVPVPDLGNVFAARNGTGTWQPISSTAFGRPTRVGASCETIGVTDFTNNKVSFFNEEPPKSAECESLADLIVGAGGGGAPLTETGRFVVAMKAYADANGGVKADFNAFVGQHRLLRAPAGLARKASTKTKKVRLVAGRVTKLKLKLPRRARAAVFATLARRHKLKGKLTLRAKTPSGRKIKLTKPIRIRAVHH